MKLLVTGGAGFIGSNFILYWLEHHLADEILNVDKLTYAGNLQNLASVANNPRYRFLKGDIADTATVREAMQGIDTVVHFAAESHVDRSLQDARPFMETNLRGTYELLEAAREAKVGRFHLVSTDEVFGDLENAAFREDTPYKPSNPYAVTKAAADMMARAFQRSFGLPVTISNGGNNYGPYQFPEKLIPLCVINALQGRELPVYGDGMQMRDWTHVEDHVRGIEAVLEKGKIGETYCISGGAEIANLEVIKGILNELGKSESLITFVPDRPGHDRRYAIDSSKIRRELGFEPQVPFAEGLSRTVRWYVEHQSWWEGVMRKEYLEYYEKQYKSNR